MELRNKGWSIQIFQRLEHQHSWKDQTGHGEYNKHNGKKNPK